MPPLDDTPSLDPATIAAHAGGRARHPHSAAVPAIEPATTFVRDADYELRDGYSYSRGGNPTVAILEDAAARLDEGSEALAFNSGMAAFSALLSTVPSGAHVIAPRVMYHGAQDLLVEASHSRGVEVDLFDPAEADGIDRALRPDTHLLWIESPVNPTWDVIDIAAAARSARVVGATVAVDSTVAPPVTTRPLELGADLVFHSATKYYGGHSDVTAGLLVTNEVDDRWASIAAARTSLGSILQSFEAWLVLRGLRTMFLRFERSSRNAAAIARHLDGHAAVTEVLYPGLAGHRGHAIAARQMTNGFGGMLSVMLAGGAEAARRLATSTKVFLPATSLGGVESLIEHRVVVEGPNSVVPPELVRLSVGIEDVDDLIEDLERALG